MVGLVVALAVAVGVLALVGRWRPSSPPHEQAELDTAEYLRPLEVAADPRTGEQLAPFTGFAIEVDTEPPEALVFVAGEERGESPVLAGVTCAPGERIPIRVEKAGFRTAHEVTRCRKDALVKLEVRLAPP